MRTETPTRARGVGARGSRRARATLRRERLSLGAVLEDQGASRLRLGHGGPGIRADADRMARAASIHIDSLWSSRPRADEAPIDVIDMFSGCGGMSAGFHCINGIVPSYRLAAAIDIDEVANRTYEANLGVVPAALDISEVARGTKLLKRISDAARRDAPLVLIGCAPCQGFSSHRNKAGEDDTRNSLFGDFARIAAKLRPDAVVVENVPELLTDRYWAFVTEARARFDRAGYYTHLAVHNMAEFGIAQERFRALMIAMPKPFAAPKGFLGRSDFRVVRDAIGRLSPVAAGVRDPNDEMHYSAAHKLSTIETIQAVPKNGGSRPEQAGPECLRRAAERNGRAVYEDVYGRLFWDRPAITITAHARNPASGRFVHPEQDRGLTVREAAMLQGFPRNYWFAGSLDQRFRQIGNAVPPAFAAFLAAHLLGELLAKPIDVREFDAGLTKPIGPSFSRLIPALKSGHRQEVLSSGGAH